MLMLRTRCVLDVDIGVDVVVTALGVDKGVQLCGT